MAISLGPLSNLVWLAMQVASLTEDGACMWDMLDMDMLGPPDTMPPVALLPAELAEMTLDECEDGIPLPPKWGKKIG